MHKFEKYTEEVYTSACENLGINPEFLREELDVIKVQDLYTAIGTRPSDEPLNNQEVILHAELGLFSHLIDDIADNVENPQLVLRVGDVVASASLHEAENVPFVLNQIIEIFSQEWGRKVGSSRELCEIYDGYIDKVSANGEVNKFAFEYSLLKMILAGFVQKASSVCGPQDKVQVVSSPPEKPSDFFRRQYRTFLETGIKYGLPESCYTNLRNDFSTSLHLVPDAVLVSNASGAQGMFYSMFNREMTKNDFTLIEIFDALMGPMAYFMNALDEDKSVKMPDEISILDVDKINFGYSEYFAIIKGTLRCLFSNDPPSRRTYLTKINQFNLGLMYIFLKDSKSPLHFTKYFNFVDYWEKRRYSLPSEYFSMAAFLNINV